VAPNGYNLLTEKITLEADWTGPAKVDTGTETCTWTWKKNGTAVDTGIENGVITIDVVNNAGATLPETGGIGTTIFYIAGSIMVLAAAVLLITKRRMSGND
jgi:LPXTG-motif cell wall-anchored protein